MTTPRAGVNLRVEDVPRFRQTCAAAGVDPTAVPVLAVLHDDTEVLMAQSLYAFSGLQVAAYRCMTPESRLPLRAPADGGLPLDAHIIGWNEADGGGEDLPGWVDSWWRLCRAQRPDLTIHYGAPNVDGWWRENAALEAALDVVDRHIGATFGPPPSTISGKPVWVTEIDVDPNHPETYGEIAACMERCLRAGIPAFAWGIQTYAPDAAYDPTTLAAIVAINQRIPLGGIGMDDAQVQQVLDQNALIADALYDLTKVISQYPSSSGAPFADLVQDAKTKVNALNPGKYSFE